MSHYLFAELPAITPFEKSLGSLLGIVVMAASLFLLRRQRAITAADGAESSAAPPPAPWRKPTAWMMFVCGMLIIAGVWIDPRVTPRYFMYHWLFVLILTMLLFLVAGFDMLSVRRQAMIDRLQLIRDNQNELRRDITNFRREHSHHTNGRPKENDG